MGEAKWGGAVMKKNHGSLFHRLQSYPPMSYPVAFFARFSLADDILLVRALSSRRAEVIGDR
jgi:hypothetical protein